MNNIYPGFGAFNDMNDTVIRHRNVQIRKLPTLEPAAGHLDSSPDLPGVSILEAV